jgi:hypothetical protein
LLLGIWLARTAARAFSKLANFALFKELLALARVKLEIPGAVLFAPGFAENAFYASRMVMHITCSIIDGIPRN